MQPENNGSPVLPDISVKLWWSAARTEGGQLQHLAVRIFSGLLNLLWRCRKRKEKWSLFRKESIINQACIFWGLLKKLNPSIMCEPLFDSNLWVNIEGKNQWTMYKYIFLMNWSAKKGSVWGSVSTKNAPFCSFPNVAFVHLHDFVHYSCHLHLYVASSKWKQQ